MKQDIHPVWHENAKVICSCGNSFVTGSTQEEIRVEICSACHPFFTGQQKFIDSLGRVEKFQKKQASASSMPIVNKRKKKILKRIGKTSEDRQPKTLKEMLTQK
ncbi:50S ribosomal protein L31 [Candidatus Shapirobacteria bacterium CG03_land_8_20_14_0_80_40_19]|uniref:Large ribosomal subunit protein bL31 n=3 Tax=Candidatus Shapironibacteriota TaxID=1752721 RepID=A0A2M7BF00_9BACT|nr:MAG: 50S ribosomal protein L31 [Candidatus Shapirobacteria bacterium CG11_big_fil_rev_8_21_14_0_20_40_12]PIV01668.1 MAG: 50S ribosomal protein L31 [Candidatus Shapirobacteria bacterium CG03_land_8_20_14_0_80_40_19]PJC28845.1 MAG: 50S ribosomal protein L31 [Candidatus Shapirobacteria bacterium CG_4_9_14_0_2_um_filter_40_11]